jgi:hypothetical protein
MLGPYEKLNGLFPLYILQFSKAGAATSPATTAQLLDELGAGKYTHVYLISHGWNNNFGDAVALYRDFFKLFLELRAKYSPAPDGAYRPVFIGLHWPSIILLLPWEKGPRFAAGSSGADAAFDSLQRVIELIAEHVEPRSVGRFYELTAKDRLGESEARELAGILGPIYQANALDAEGDRMAEVGIDGIIASWMSLPDDGAPQTAPDYGAHGRAQKRSTEVRAASAADLLDPRNAVRVTTVLMMKDRSGLVGRFGLMPLLQQLIPVAGNVPIRIIGHSYGARVLMTALSSPDLDSMRVGSALLLQPAVNQYCFAASVPGLGLGVPGGFVPALGRVGLPVYSTFSAQDGPLQTFFHFAARRSEDKGEIRFASAGPSEFSALGGYGPDGIVPREAAKEVPIHSDGDRYEYGKDMKVLALDGSGGPIQGHGDVRTKYTCWALLDQELANVL